jgi:hypothetical protein
MLMSWGATEYSFEKTKGSVPTFVPGASIAVFIFIGDCLVPPQAAILVFQLDGPGPFKNGGARK